MLTRAPNSFTQAGPQTQLWYSNQGQPWSFDAVQAALLVGSESTTLIGASADIPYGDQVAGLAKVGSFLLLFKTLTTWILSGVDEDTYTPIPLFSDIGAHRACIVDEGAGACVLAVSGGKAATQYDGANLELISEKPLQHSCKRFHLIR